MNRNGMGPQNSGPLTGRRMGHCNRDTVSNPDVSASAERGRGYGQGLGHRRGPGIGKGRGRGGYRTGAGDQTEAALLMRIEALESDIRALKGKSL